jgi:hypothetical protein
MAEVILQLDLTFSNIERMHLAPTKITITRQVTSKSEVDDAKTGFLQHIK